jgi:DNA-directed RNA polymerase II subunit RPB2
MARSESMQSQRAHGPGQGGEAPPWPVIEAYFRGRHLRQLVRHQVESYNDMVSCQIPRTIAMFNPVRVKSDHDFVPELDTHRLEVAITFSNFGVHQPQIHENNGATKLMFPHEARLRNFTYAATMTVDMNIKYTVRTGEALDAEQIIHRSLTGVQIGKLPIMLRSGICVLSQYRHLPPAETGECAMDPGGYFIINGSEKTCLGQERAAENQVQCFNVSKGGGRWDWQAEIKSVPAHKCISPKQVTLYRAARDSGRGHPLSLQLPRIKAPVPLFVVFRALGVESDKAICRLIVSHPDAEPESESGRVLAELEASVVDGCGQMTQEEALEYITSLALYTPINVDKETGAKRKRAFTVDVLAKDLFPHCNNAEEKRYFLGHMTHELVRASLGWRAPDDRDSYANKRIDLTGALLNNLFRNYFNKLIKDMQKQTVREINNGSWRATEDYASIINMTNIYKIVKASTLENGLKRALATGDFGIKHANSSKVGVAQVLNRLTYIASLSHLRRVNTPIDKSGKLIPPRKLHSTSWGYLCPAETPEGGSVGVVKNLAYMCHVTIPCSSEALMACVAPHVVLLEDCDSKQLFEGVRVFVNGAWVGQARDPPELYRDLKDKKHKGILNIYTSIAFDPGAKELRTCTDAGRVTRPLLRVIEGKTLLSASHMRGLGSGELRWDDLLTDVRGGPAPLEYLDAREQARALIAMEPSQLTEDCAPPYTHCEIHPSTILGILASCIPFPEHNQSPRNTYQCAMGKQAMGMYVTNFDTRMDKTAYVLSYAMRPLVDTRLMNMIRLNAIPSGGQVVVAIMTHTGYNQEDSILFNAGAVGRGLFMATVYHTEKDEDKKVHGDEEVRCKPDPSRTKAMKFGNYDKLMAQGVVPEGTLLENRDILIGKVVPIREARADPTTVIKFRDQSRLFRTHEEAYVDRNYQQRNGDGYNLCKVRVRTLRKPVIGDKFSSRHGQKGTIGNIIPEEDMPFTADGVRPDLIINPHAIPSRMTIAQLKETLLGKVLLQLGLFGDGTSFGGLSIETICQELRRAGCESRGNELLYSGLTGEQLEADVFIGPVFYQRLKHMVADKQHSRSIGPMVNLTRQPAEGRSRDGGLRYGEMERDCMCAHGAARFNKGRVYDASDAFRVHVCRRCGLVAAYNDKLHVHLCRTCDNRKDFAYVELPYSCKLMFQELLAMNIAPRLIT